MEITYEEKEELLHLIRRRYGYDFSDYSEASILRRIKRFAEIHTIATMFDIKHHLLNDESLFAEFVREITVNVTEMFRDPHFFQAIRKSVFPALKTYPFCRIWHAGCSTGQEVYSMAIMLQEEELYERTRIYATDINPDVLREAKEGIFPLKCMREYTHNHIQAGNKIPFSEYYTAHYEQAIMNKTLKEHMIFSVHNLVGDSSFNEFNMIVCRNVLIYFNRKLQEHVFRLFYESLSPFGYLALGSKESLHFSSMAAKFETIDAEAKIYRKIP